MSLTNLAPALQASVNQVMEHLGPALAEALIYNTSGHAARSELDKISDPLKKLVVKQVRAKSWLETALFQKNLLGDKIGEGDRKIFLQKIIAQVTLFQKCRCCRCLTSLRIGFEEQSKRIKSCETFGWLVEAQASHMLLKN